jgi:hypothetical protein
MHEPDKINLIHSTFCSHLLLHGRKTGLKISYFKLFTIGPKLMDNGNVINRLHEQLHFYSRKKVTF